MESRTPARPFPASYLPGLLSRLGSDYLYPCPRVVFASPHWQGCFLSPRPWRMRVSGRARERERAELKMRVVSDHPGVERQVSTPSSHVVSLHLTPSLSPEAVDALMCGEHLPVLPPKSSVSYRKTRKIK